MEDEQERLLSEKLGPEKDAQIAKKISEFGGLLTRAAAVRLLCRQNGVEVDLPIPLSKARGTALPFSFCARVDRVFPVQEFPGGSSKTIRLHVSDADGEGEATLVLWNEQAALVEKGSIGCGDDIEVKGAYFRSGEISVGRGGKITKIGGAKTAQLSKLEDGACSVEGTVKEVGPDKEYADRKTGERRSFSSFLLCDETECRRVVVWGENGAAAKPDAGDKVRLEGMLCKNGELHFNARSRMAVLSSKKERLGKVEKAEIVDGNALIGIDGAEFLLPLKDALALLGVKVVPQGVEESTLFLIKAGGMVGKSARYRKDGAKLSWLALD
jgi:hypothetical protein